jgi:hypothetical protein
MLWHRKLLLCASLSLLFVFMLGSKTFATIETKLLASDGAAHDWFGYSVSISGDVALVGCLLTVGFVFFSICAILPLYCKSVYLSQ